jgi:hypothetical protein
MVNFYKHLATFIVIVLIAIVGTMIVLTSIGNTHALNISIALLLFDRLIAIIKSNVKQ